MSYALHHRSMGLGLITAAVLTGCSDTSPAGPSPEVTHPTLSRVAPTFRFTSIEVPGATLTEAQGINAAGQVVGWYYTAAEGRLHGFVTEGNGFTTIDYPGAFHTDVRGIGPNGELVGNFSAEDEPGVAYHGFRRDAHGAFTPVHYDGHKYEILQRILPNGTILGCRHDDNTTSTMVGITINAQGVGSEIDAYASMHNGATPDRRLIVGLYTNTTMTPARQEGYVIEDGQFTPFMVPGSNFTTAWDVNPRGEIAGVYRDAALNRFHGYVRDGDDYVTLDFPDASATRAFGINAGGDVVGTFVKAGVTRAFVASRTRGHMP